MFWYALGSAPPPHSPPNLGRQANCLCPTMFRNAAVAPKFNMDLKMMYKMVSKPGWLQVVKMAGSPINRHPNNWLPV